MTDSHDITVAVYKMDGWRHRSYENPFIAMVPSNPALRSSGKTSEEAVANLEKLIFSHIVANGELVGVFSISLDELIIRQIMER